MIDSKKIVGILMVCLMLVSLAAPVLAANGDAVAGATVNIHVIGSGSYNKMSMLTTDDTGHYEAMFAPGQIWDMEANKTGYLTEHVYTYGEGPNLPSTGDLQKNIVLVKAPAKNCTVKGYVRSESGSAISGANISINWMDNQTHYVFLPKVTTDASGYYNFAAMPGDYILWFNADGYYGVYECTFSLYGGVKWVNETLKSQPTPDAHITGIITDQQSNYLSGVSVYASGINSDTFYSYGSASSDSSGAYDVAVPAGTYNVTYSYYDSTTGTHYYDVTRQITVASGDTHAEDVTMVAIPTYQMTLQVNDATGSPLQSVSVNWQISNDSVTFVDYGYGYTDSSGKLNISACLGTGSATLSLNNYWSKTVNLDMNRMKGTTVTSTMEQILKDATISGNVTVDGTPVPNQRVSITVTASQGSYSDYATADLSGSYSISIPVGTVNITAFYYDTATSQSLRFSDTFIVSSGDQKTENIDFHLVPESIRVYGTVTEGVYTGAPSGLLDDLNGDGIPDNAPITNDTGGGTITPVVTVGNASAVITADTGGTVAISGSITVEVPPGAINGSLNITVQEETGSSPTGFTLLGNVYEIGPTGTQFSEPVNITLHYNPADVPSGMSETNIHIYWYNEQTNSWVDMGGTVNTANHTVTIQVTHLSKYAMMVSSTDTGSGGTSDPLGLLGYIGPIPILILVILLVLIVVIAVAKGGRKKKAAPPYQYGQQSYRQPPPAYAPPAQRPPAYQQPQQPRQQAPPQYNQQYNQPPAPAYQPPPQPAYQPAPQPAQPSPTPPPAPAPVRQQSRPKPTTGRCSKCGSTSLTFNDDGSGRCNQCGHTFWWDKSRAPPSF